MLLEMSEAGVLRMGLFVMLVLEMEAVVEMLRIQEHTPMSLAPTEKGVQVGEHEAKIRT